MKSKLESLFADAVAAGYAKPTLRTEHFKFTKAPDGGRNPGAIYVTAGHTYAGKIINNQAFTVGTLTPAQLDEIYETMTSPQIAAVKFGHQTGQCSICGRRLDNKLSIALGIGPICNEKFGWTLPADYYDDSL